MRVSWCLFLLVCFGALPCWAGAGFSLEPYLGYEVGSLQENITNFRSPLLGARVGLKFLGGTIRAGADARYEPFGKARVKSEGVADTLYNFKPTDLGAFTMLSFGGFRVYASFLLFTGVHGAGFEKEVKKSATKEDVEKVLKLTKGSAWGWGSRGVRLGVGWRRSYVAFNVEASFRKFKWDHLKSVLKSASNQSFGQAYTFTVSFPLI